MYARWHDAMVMQQQALAFTESLRGHTMIDAFEEELNGQHSEESQLRRGVIWELTKATLKQSDPIYVSHDVTQIIDHARESFEPEVVWATDLIVPCGFLVFPYSLRVLDADHDQALRDEEERPCAPVRAISWLPVQPNANAGMASGGLWVTFWTHADDDQNGRDLRARNPSAVLSILHTFVVSYGRTAWLEGLAEDVRERGRSQWLLPQVTWRLMKQVVHSRELAARPFRRDARRKDMSDEVTVIRLRRDADYVHDEGEGGRLTHRFLVRGHWRNQFYPSLGDVEDPASHRQIWVAPYVKGPEGAELKVTDRVFEFVR